MNYFELFDLPERPRIDNTRVAKKYFELQKKYHPDFYTNEDEAAKEDALDISAHINRAFKTFKNPDLTLEYFLKQKGVVVDDEKYNLPQDFLLEVMDINESLLEGEIGESEQLSTLQNDLNQSVASILADDNKDGFNENELEHLKEFYYKKKYLRRILDRIKD